MSEADRLYVYAIVRAPAPPTEALSGMEGRSVSTLTRGGLTAIVSSAPRKRLRPARRNLKAHQGVLTALMDETTPLPMAFGTIASRGDLQALLDEEAAALIGQLAIVQDAVEMTVRVDWDVEDIVSWFVDRTPDLREARDALFAGGRTPTTDEKIAVGQRFDAARTRARKQAAERLRTALGPACRAISIDEARGEAGVVRLSCLVPREGREAFEAAIYAAAEHFDDDHAFTFTGPGPPSSFVDLRLATPAAAA